MTAQVYRIIGAPGTGKTTTIRGTIMQWIERDNYDPEQIILTSFTTAAAKVLRERVPVPDRNCATIHALCYRGLGNPPLAMKGELRKEWNALCIKKGVGSWCIGDTKQDEDEPVTDAGQDHRLEQYGYWRIVGRPESFLAKDLQPFIEEWEAFKKRTGSIDFTDMLEHGLSRLSNCPGSPTILCVDEAQDLNPLQWALIKQWQQGVDRLLIAGDAAQCLYQWQGATPDLLMTPWEGEQYYLLPKSNRLPARIQRYAEGWLHEHSGDLCVGREYAPIKDKDGIPIEGHISFSDATWKDVEPIVDEIELQARVRKVMVLATCGYMLQPLLNELRSRGIAYHNPYSPKNRSWNPGSEKGWHAAGQLMEGGQDWYSWGQHLPAIHFNGFKNAAAGKPAGEALTGEVYQRVYLGHDWRYYLGLVKDQRAIEYALRCIDNEWESPTVIVGSVHSVKGGEADCVVIFPDVSPAGYDEMDTDRDATIRQFYVAMTRAKDELILCRPASNTRCIEWP